MMLKLNAASTRWVDRLLELPSWSWLHKGTAVMFRFWFLAFITNLMPTAFRSLICTWQLHAPTTSLVYIQAYSLYVWNSGTFMCALLLAWKKENGMMHASGREKWTDQWHHRSWKRSGARTRQWGQGRKVTRWDSQARFWWRPGSTGIKKCETIRLISPRPQRWNEMKPSISGEWIIWPSEPCDDALRIQWWCVAHTLLLRVWFFLNSSSCSTCGRPFPIHKQNDSFERYVLPSKTGYYSIIVSFFFPRHLQFVGNLISAPLVRSLERMNVNVSFQ